MTKALIGLLVAVNLAFFAWTQGAFDSLTGTPSWRSIGDREPERLQRQVHAERITVLPPGAASQAAPAPAPAACLEAGPFAAGPGLDAAQAAVQNVVPAGGLEVARTEQSASWGVYMGRYAVPGALQRKEDELQRIGVAYEEITSPAALVPGLVLGRFGERAAANQALAEIVARGVRTARVVQLAEAATLFRLRVAKADAAAAERLKGLTGDAALAGRAFGDCVTPP